MPRPRANPLTSWVLPAPNSLASPSTSPPRAARPHSAPNAAVSSGLCEMNVAMFGDFAHALLRADLQAGFRRYSANATQRQAGKLFLPGIAQWHGVLAGHREQQLEILAVGQRRQQRRQGGRFGARLLFGSA